MDIPKLRKLEEVFSKLNYTHSRVSSIILICARNISHIDNNIFLITKYLLQLV